MKHNTSQTIKSLLIFFLFIVTAGILSALYASYSPSSFPGAKGYFILAVICGLTFLICHLKGKERNFSIKTTALVLLIGLNLSFWYHAYRWDMGLQGFESSDGEMWWVSHGDLARLDAIRGYVKALVQIIAVDGIALLVFLYEQAKNKITKR